jgi:hypothetical protein
MKNVQNIFNYKTDKGKFFTEPTQTIPEEAMSMREILDRYSKGLDLGATAKIPIYDDEPESSNGINLKTLDLVELHQVAEMQKDKVKKAKTALDEENKASKLAAQEAEENKIMTFIKKHTNNAKEIENQ